MPAEFSDKHSSSIRIAASFFRRNILAVVVISTLLVIPCFWHSRIQAGDLGSHVYSGWLAQWIEHHQSPGLTVVRQWNNVLFDLLLLYAGNLFGFAAAEKIVVSFAVLVFFWGSFSFLVQLSGRLPWRLTPLLMVLSYGYVFHMGFMNYYLSLGFAFLALALVWRRGAGNWLLAAVFSVPGFLAHPIGFLLIVSIGPDVSLWTVLSRWLRLVLPVICIIAIAVCKC